MATAEQIRSEAFRDRRNLADALLNAVDVLRNCVLDGAGCDDAAARRKAIEDGEAALRAAGVRVPVAEDAPIASGYGVRVRKAEVRADPITMMDEWQVWVTGKTGRYAILQRFDFEHKAQACAADIRAIRKRDGVKP